jgi:hypothetical protein
MRFSKSVFAGLLSLTVLFQWGAADEIGTLKSPDGQNEFFLFLENGRLSYSLQRQGKSLLERSPLGLVCREEDFSRDMVLYETGNETARGEHYRRMGGNLLNGDSTLITKQWILKNQNGSLLTFELAAGNEGFGFRYLLDQNVRPVYTVTKEVSGFQIPLTASAWLQPYHAAGSYTPAYEDFYFRVSPGDQPPRSREEPRGWCLPALFEIASAQSWLLMAESDVDGLYAASHLDSIASSKGLYQLSFPYEDEVTGAKTFSRDSKQTAVSTFKTPWRVVIIGGQASDILNSTLITDLASPSQMAETSWIHPGRASWAWWSHPDGPANQELFNSFTDLAVQFGWEYTLFDAGWWNAGLDEISNYALTHGIRPLVWMHASDFYNPQTRSRRLDEMADKGIKGIKVDFWCSDRQETMAAMLATLEEAAKRKLVVVFHGCTIPSGWHRTWPNLLSAEAVLGTESYFYESRYPEKTAEQNTILPFTRNVLAPMDTTPVALTIRKFPRKTTAVHELAAAIVFNSGIIHYADSVEVFTAFPDEVKEVLRQVPAAWDRTVCLEGEPGRRLVMARHNGCCWMVAGLNGTNQVISVNLDLKPLGTFRDCVVITEGQEPLMQFSIQKTKGLSQWQGQIQPFGGFILELKP